MNGAVEENSSTHASERIDAQAPSEPIFVERIRPRKGWQLIDFAELYRYRELAWVLALRDLKARYKQTIIGAAWAILQPLTVMVIFSTLFYLLGRYPASKGAAYPYAVTVFCGLLPWQFFAATLRQSSESLLTNQAMIRKVYFPRIILPAVSLVSALVDFLIAFCILIVMMVYFGIAPSWRLTALPLLLLLSAAAGLGLGFWLSALNALYRDLRYAVPFVIQVLFYLTPVIYESGEMIPPQWRTLYFLNPLAGVTEGFRWALLGSPAPPLAGIAVSTLAVILLFVSGMYFFRRLERTFVDWI